MSVIYLITCTETDDTYVGSTSGWKDRRQAHVRDLRRNKHSNPHLQALWNWRCNEDAFKFEVLEVCAIPQRYVREQHYIETLRPTLNKLRAPTRFTASLTERDYL